MLIQSIGGGYSAPSSKGLCGLGWHGWGQFLNNSSSKCVVFGVGSSSSLSNKVFILYLSYGMLNMVWAERGWVGRGKEMEKGERRRERERSDK